MRNGLAWVLCVAGAAALAACGDDTTGTGGAGGGASSASSGTEAASSGSGTGTSSNTTTGGEGGEGAGSPNTTSGGDGGGGGTGEGGGSGGSGAGGAGPIWEPVALPAFVTLDGTEVSTENLDVTGIYFDSPDHGVAAVAANSLYFHSKIFEMEGGTFTAEPVFDGEEALGGGEVRINGLDVVAGDQLVGRADYDNFFLTSTDGGHTFSNGKLGIIDGETGAGPNPQLLLQPKGDGSDGWLLVSSFGGVRQAPAAPSLNTPWNITWCPDCVPSIPDPLPEGGCTVGPNNGFWAANYRGNSVYAAPDGSRIVYAKFQLDDDIGVCVSTDGGLTFSSVLFPDPPASIGHQPEALHFTSPLNGVAAWGNELIGEEKYVYYTTDGGLTWTQGEFPDSAPAFNVNRITSTPDGETLFLLGRQPPNSSVTLLRSTDGGATWQDLSNGAAIIPGGKFYSIFALDPDHVWIGGWKTGLYRTQSGGE